MEDFVDFDPEENLESENISSWPLHSAADPYADRVATPTAYDKLLLSNSSAADPKPAEQEPPLGIAPSETQFELDDVLPTSSAQLDDVDCQQMSTVIIDEQTHPVDPFLEALSQVLSYSRQLERAGCGLAKSKH